MSRSEVGCAGQSAISKSGIRFCVRSRAKSLKKAHDLYAKPLTLGRIMRMSCGDLFVRDTGVGTH
ncbi:MAG: hypothetical protein QOE39_4291, partial [Bradyrhizobium sp.]|nr:hypothetical protein [Bradyrhizobium sp.]